MASVAFAPKLKICYVDESGGFEPEGSTGSATPLMVIAGLVLDHADLRVLTAEYLRLKKTFFPGARKVSGYPLDYILDETKATDLRRELRSSSRDQRRHALGFLDKIVLLLERHNAQVIGRIWVKQPGLGLDPASSYAYAIQDIAKHFNHLLEEVGDVGQIVCDSRLHTQNRQVSHSIFTLKHRNFGMYYPSSLKARPSVLVTTMLACRLQIYWLVRSYSPWPAEHTARGAPRHRMWMRASTS